MSKNPQQKSGLILLVVLSMLTLFSLLSITYVVFSSQSRTSSMGMARRDHHRMEQSRLLDYSLQQVLRGSKTGSLSSIAQHSLLADVYGHRQSLIATNTVSKARYTTGSDRAEFFASRFLRIPLDNTLGATGITPPTEHDLLTGRVLTFLEGPLRNVSFRIVRSLGVVAAVPDLNYSVIVDLMEASKSKSSSLADWISSGATTLCQNATTNTGYAIRINDRETNGFGFGINSDGTNVQVSGMNENLTESLLARYTATAGDTDESYDAADFNDQWLAHRRSGASAAEDILPSFHRAALINYIIESVPDYGNTTNFTQPMFLDLLNKIQLACPRPLGISVRNLEGGGSYSSNNPDFSGSNSGLIPGQTPTLDIDLGGKWTNWTVGGAGGKSPKDSFLEFAKFLTTGPWDVDNDGDGLADSVWVDLDLPLMTSPEGKLLKMLTAYYITDLDSRLDLNAVGNLHQTTTPAYNPPTANTAFSLQSISFPQGFGSGPADSSLRHLFGSDADYTAFLEARYGGTNGTPGDGSSIAIAALVDDGRSRLDGGGKVINPLTGILENTGTRERRQTVRSDQLPGLSIAIRGGEALGFDRLGNPLLARGTSATLPDQGTDDPYEFRLLDMPHNDLPISIAEWERIYRKYDWDVSMLPRRLKPYPSLDLYANAVAPRTAHMRNVPLTAPSTTATNPVDSLYELIVQIGQRRSTMLPPAGFTLDLDMFNELFPFEFGRGTAMDLNRSFGNGVDDDLDGQIDEPEELLKNRRDDNGNGQIDELTEQDVFLHHQGSLYLNGGAASGVAYVTTADEYPTLGRGYAINDNLDPQFEALLSSSPLIARNHHGQQSRQLLARNIYCLAMLLLPDSLYLSNHGGVAITGNERARAIAQWAVNVIDFRDADHAMTRFPYDPDPFMKVTTDKGLEPVYWVPNADNMHGDPNGEVVWGMEQPELLLTETLATHDVRIKDTGEDSSGKTQAAGDSTFDQYRIPEGSLFLEFFCPRTTSTPADPSVPGAGSSLYTAGATNMELNLNALSPSDGVTNYPVWRVAFSAPHTLTSSQSGSTLTYQLPLPSPTPPPTPAPPKNEDLAGLLFDTTRAIAPPAIDRILWFTNQGNVTDVAAAAVGLPLSLTPAEIPAHVFGNVDPAGALSIQGGQYLVVGSRQTTYFGSQTNAGNANTNLPSDHRIVLENSALTSGTIPVGATSWANLYIPSSTTGGTPIGKRAAMRDSVSMVAVTPAPWASGGTTRLPPTVGISVSEPFAIPGTYYQTPAESVNSNNNTAAPNGAAGFGTAGTYKDGYHDYGTNAGQLPDTPFDSKPTTPIGSEYVKTHPMHTSGVPTPGTALDWCTAYLQRLADPERPWHAVFNPYMTVDWMQVDLTVFSGEETITGGTFNFGSRQKTGDVGSAGRGTSFLSYKNDAPAVTTGAGTTEYFTHRLAIDNATNLISTVPQVKRPTTAATNFTTFGYLNSPFELLNEPNATVSVPPIYIGSPATAPLSMTWFNRPFASPYELMLVPLCSPGQLMQEFAPPATSGLVAASPTYAPTSINSFTHLPNFFQPRDVANNYAGSTMFELMTTPSQWSDADSVIPPTELATVTPIAANVRAFTALGPLMPPFNRVSKMVERGRLNLNTVSEEAAWQGVEWNYMNAVGAGRSTIGSTSYWTNLVASRRGYTPTGGKIIGGNAQLNPAYPTEFAGVFKSQFAFGLVPTIRTPLSLDAGFPAVPPGTPPVLTAATVFRQSPASSTPLFSIRTDLGGGGSMLPAHAFNEYLPITRLANLTTNRSNVFAVHMTIGYFEYDPSTGMTQEYGWDNGKTRRHRGFYVIDRSIPVAFEPGIDHNTENCVLMRRIIE